MKRLNEDLKNNEFKSIYLLCGEERYLKKMYKDRLTKGMVGEDDSMNYSYFEGKGIPTKEIIDLAETLPFFFERRLIVIENSGFFKNANIELAEYIKELCPSTNLLFVEEEIDKRGKLYKSVKDKGCIVEFGTQDSQTLYRWIGSLFKKEARMADDRTIRYLVEKVGEDMQRIQGEVEKLVCYTYGRTSITIEDIEAICVSQISNQIFEMVNAVADKKQKQALEYYYELLSLREPPMRILFLLTRQFRLLYQVKSFEGKGYSNKEIASRLGVQPFIVTKCMAQAKHFPLEGLRAIVEDAADTEEAVKTGRLTDKLGVELFIVKYSLT
ncbi:MAG: DNA polymerase III subunit delta [Eubacteriales bacterium]